MKMNGKSILIYILLCSLLVSLVFCVSGCTSKEPWTGTWESDQWGEMNLTQDGTTVTGVYEWDGGKIAGTVSGNTLRGTWSEAPTYAPLNDAGDFEFTLSDDGKSFTGKWRYGSDGDWNGDWTGQKK